MKNYSFAIVIHLFLVFSITLPSVHAVGLEERVISLQSNERFELLQANRVTFKFKPLSEDARKLEITQGASSLGVAYLGQIQLKDNTTALSALRSIADQIGDSLKINFGVIADSNTSEALKANELLLLYHPNVVITLALARPDPTNPYEIICTYALKELGVVQANKAPSSQQPVQGQPSITPQNSAATNNIIPAETISDE